MYLRDKYELKNIVIGNRETNIDKYDYSMIYGYIYIIILPDTRYYIGQKKYHPDKSPRYYGSGSHLNNIILKMTGFRSKDLNVDVADNKSICKFVIDYAIDQNELNYLERVYIERGKLFEEFDGQCLNIHDGGGQGYYTAPGKFKITEQSIKKAKETKRIRREHGLYRLSEETRKKMSEGIKVARKKKPVWNKGLTRKDDERLDKMFIDKDYSFMKTESYKEMVSEKFRNLLWYNNGIKNIRIRLGDSIPDGFVRGMLGKRDESEKCERPCINKRTNQKFESISEAARLLNCTENSIIKSCDNKNAYAFDRHGFYIGKFEYL